MVADGAERRGRGGFDGLGGCGGKILGWEI